MLSFYSPFWVKRSVTGATGYSYPAIMFYYGYANRGAGTENQYYDNNIAALDLTSNLPSGVISIGEVYTASDGGDWFNISDHVYSWHDDLLYLYGSETGPSNPTGTKLHVVWDPRTRTKLSTFQLVDPLSEGYTKVADVTESYIWALSITADPFSTKILKRYDKTTKAYVDTIDVNDFVVEVESNPSWKNEWSLRAISDTFLIYCNGDDSSNPSPRIHAIRYDGAAWNVLTVNLPPYTLLPDWHLQWNEAMPFEFAYDPTNDTVWLPCKSSNDDFPYSKLYLSGVGPNGTNTFVDESPIFRISNKPVITRVGDVSFDTSQSIAGRSSSMRFDGSTGYLSTTIIGYALSSQAFTFEAWVRLATLPVAGTSPTSMQMIFSRRASDTSRMYLAIADWTGVDVIKGLWFRSDNSASNINNILAPYDFAIDTWYHVAVSSTVAGSIKLWVNGTEVGASSGVIKSFPGGTAPLLIGSGWLDNYRFNGWMNNFWLINRGRYNASFTPVIDVTSAQPNAYCIGANLTTGVLTSLMSPANENWDGLSVFFDRKTRKKFIEFDVVISDPGSSNDAFENGCAEFDPNNQLIGVHGRDLATDNKGYTWACFRPVGDYIIADVGNNNESYNDALFKIGAPTKMPVGHVLTNHLRDLFAISSYSNEWFYMLPAAERAAASEPLFNRAPPEILDSFTVGDQLYQFFGPYNTSFLSPTEQPILWFEVNYTGKYAGYQLSVEQYVSPHSNTPIGSTNSKFGYSLYDTEGNLRIGNGNKGNDDSFALLTSYKTPPGRYYLAVYVNTGDNEAYQRNLQTEDGFMSMAYSTRTYTDFYLLARAY